MLSFLGGTPEILSIRVEAEALERFRREIEGLARPGSWQKFKDSPQEKLYYR
jgi:hypothetical protein